MRKSGQLNNESIENEEFNDEEINFNFNDEIKMSDNQLITEIQKNSKLELKLALLQKDYDSLKEKLQLFEDQSVKIARLQSQLEDFEDIQDQFRDCQEELEGAVESMQEAENKNVDLGKKLTRISVENLCRWAMQGHSNLELNHLQKLGHKAKLEEPETLKFPGLTVSRKAGNKIYKISKI